MADMKAVAEKGISGLEKAGAGTGTCALVEADGITWLWFKAH